MSHYIDRRNFAKRSSMTAAGLLAFRTPPGVFTVVFVFLASITGRVNAGEGERGTQALDDRTGEAPDAPPPSLDLPQDLEPPERMRLLFESVQAAQRLGRVGAVYEAARVLKAVAEAAPDDEPGRAARRILAEWDVGERELRPGDAARIRARISGAIRQERNAGEIAARIRNLIELGEYETAALEIRRFAERDTGARARSRVVEILAAYGLTPDLFDPDRTFDAQDLLEGVRQARRTAAVSHEIRAQSRTDPETVSLLRVLWGGAYPDSRLARELDHPRHVPGFERQLRQPYFEFVRDRGPSPFEPARGPSFTSAEEAAGRALERARSITRAKPTTARLLLELLIAAVPESREAKTAVELLAAKGGGATGSSGTATVSPRQERQSERAGAAFDWEAVHDYALELSPEAMAALRRDPKTYVRGTFREGTSLYADVGVRLKGGIGTFRMFDGHSKVSFTVKFNEFVKGQRFRGLRRIILAGALQDSSFLCENIGYGLFRDAGVPAPRVTYANVIFNGEPYGFYVQVEAITRDFLRGWFENVGGNLYEGPGDMTHWKSLELDSNQEADDRRDLQALSEAVRDAEDSDPWQTLKDYVDVETFTRFLCLELLIGHWDGYTHAHNYRMYYDASRKRFVYIPHGADQVLRDLDALIFQPLDGILARALVETESGRRRFRETLRRLLDEVWDEDRIRARIAAVYARIRPHVLKDTRKPGDNAQFEDSVGRILEFVAMRRHGILAELEADERGGGSWRTPLPPIRPGGRRSFGPEPGFRELRRGAP